MDDDSWESFAQAAAHSLAYLRRQPARRIRLGDRTFGAAVLIATLEELVAIRRATPRGTDLRERLRRSFDLFAFTPPPEVRYSAYFEPVVPARRERGGSFRYPLYRQPPDLVVALDGKRRVGRLDERGRLVPYFTRAEIDVEQRLAGKGLEIAWLETPFDRWDLHVQGSGLLVFPGGRKVRAQYAATNGHPYRSVGAALVRGGAIPRATRARLRRYFAAHPEAEAWLSSQNPRYTFFELVQTSPDGAPPGAIRRPLTAGRSIAVDPAHVPLGAVAWASFPLPAAERSLEKRTTRRFVLAQDTGGAIRGPQRVDFYVGQGAGAEGVAARVWDLGRLSVLLKKGPAR